MRTLLLWTSPVGNMMYDEKTLFHGKSTKPWRRKRVHHVRDILPEDAPVTRGMIDEPLCMVTGFFAAAKKLERELIAQRRDFHRHPELGYQEVCTSAIVAR